ncbi:hypothetical protein PLICRDRAFT_44298 [Plicaturopsis crispa FD-325 SS-3]|nr:hypothetical protein PLICRDRAFT_44298 [Plicaturopsis crispa FD-325 SS-3]
METVELARQKIDEEIELLLRPVRALRTKRNALASVHRLPTELLSEIFVHARANWKDLTSVCSHWRSVSLQCPLLWNQLLDPYHSCAEWTELVLKRSKNSPIKLDLSIWTFSESNESTDLALQHAARASRIVLSGDTTFLNDVTGRITGPAPLLEVLRIHRCSVRGEDGPPFIPHYAFCRSAPRLRLLELEHSSWCWNRPLPNCLTSLSVVRPSCRDAPHTRLSISQLLRILGETPALESLTLVDALREDPLDVIPASLRVSLPHLRQLQHGDDISTGVFLRHILFPSSTKFSVDWNADAANPSGGLSTALAAFRETSVRSANQIVIQRSAFSLIVAYEGLDEFPILPIPTTHLKLALRFRSEWEWTSLLPVLLGQLEFDHLFRLCVSGGVITADDWDGHLAALGDLEVIQADGDACYGLVEALTVENATVAAPRLYKLELAEVDLEYILRDMLEDCLESRRARNAKIDHLKLIACDYTAFQTSDHVISHFERMGCEVDWKQAKEYTRY